MISWLPSLATTVIAMGVALYLWQRRSVVGAGPLMALMVAVAWWSLGYALEFRSPGVSAKVWWVRFEYLGVVVVPPLWLAFALRFTGRERWLTGRNVILLGVVPLATLLLVWTNDLHHLMWTRVWLETSGPFSVLAYARAPGFWLFVAFAYLLLLAGTILLVQEFIRSRHLQRRQVGILLFGVTAPWLGNALYVSGLSPLPHLDLTPFALTLTGLACAWGLFRFKLMTLVPIGREAVMEAMSDAFLVLDNQGRIVDLNATALEIIGRKASGVVGRPVSQFFPEGQAWTGRLGKGTDDRTEMALGRGEDQRHFDRRLSPLFDRRGKSLGRLVILRDISDQQRAEEERHRQLEYLQSLQAIDQVIRQTGDLERMLTEVIEQVFTTFDCDRAWLLYPCDPEAPSWRIPFEATRPEYPGALAQNEEVAMKPDTQEAFREQLAAEGPLTYGPNSQLPMVGAGKRYGVRSQMCMAIHPRLGQPWLLGVHQCSHAREWTEGERSLFADIAHRIADAVSNLLFFRNLQESEERFRSLSENAPDLICTLDRRGDLTYVNPAWERILGHRPAEM
ncbi:MAG: PAS domain S-box protein, partial [Proteobacteria bacterium]|nr:PAS domain S-box protein [Pseudomonadota bacterium]